VIIVSYSELDAVVADKNYQGALYNQSSMSFHPPQKAILSPAQLEWFQTSETHKTVISYIETLNEVIVGAKLSDQCEESVGVKAILQILDRVEQVAKDTPPVENSASRFGNPAFRTFYDKMNEVCYLL
jgi:serine/threonine-protein phosphatase 2A activator